MSARRESQNAGNAGFPGIAGASVKINNIVTAFSLSLAGTGILLRNEKNQSSFFCAIAFHVPSGHFCLSEFRVFGTADGDAPKAVKGLKVVRDKNDRRNAMISWNKSADAYGYNIYYGIAPDKMYNAITVYGDTFYDMRGLDLATDYYFAIEALNESGVSVKSKIIKQ